ncbi:hypothetical protein F2P79_013341 [Pimephales promelas]|nr:hypothetical protein F2P79_013341 [Pimephales promelas]
MNLATRRRVRRTSRLVAKYLLNGSVMQVGHLRYPVYTGDKERLVTGCVRRAHWFVCVGAG